MLTRVVFPKKIFFFSRAFASIGKNGRAFASIGKNGRVIGEEGPEKPDLVKDIEYCSFLEKECEKWRKLASFTKNEAWYFAGVGDQISSFERELAFLKTETRLWEELMEKKAWPQKKMAEAAISEVQTWYLLNGSEEENDQIEQDIEKTLYGDMCMMAEEKQIYWEAQANIWAEKAKKLKEDEEEESDF